MTTITIDPVTRIEGHAKVLMDLDDAGQITFAGIVVNELRGFERILVGMEADAMPQVTARICGVCPSAHHLAAAKAIDAAAGVEPPPAAARMRELLYMGHFIHSHAVHLFALLGPDLVFGLDGPPAKQNIVGLVEANPELVTKALRLRSLGQKINEAVGGRGVHPVTAVAGGMSFEMTAELRQRVAAMAEEAVALASELGPVVKELLSKRLEAHPGLIGVSTSSAYAGTITPDGTPSFYDGLIRVMSPDGEIKNEFAAADYDQHLLERTYDWSYMKPVYVVYDGEEHVYRAGALARVNLAERFDTPLAQAELEAFRAEHGRPCHLTLLQIHAQLIELIHACERAKALVADDTIMGDARVPVEYRGGRGVGHVEAPRGTLIHDYEIDEKGIVRSANLIVATQQNYAAMNESIQQTANLLVAGKGDDALLNGVEFAIRCYDPCLACATHAVGEMPMEIILRRPDGSVRTVRRGS